MSGVTLTKVLWLRTQNKNDESNDDESRDRGVSKGQRDVGETKENERGANLNSEWKGCNDKR